MAGYETLLQHEREWVTDIGAWFPGERVVLRGKDMFSELNDIPWMGVLLYAITGRMPGDSQIKLFEGFWVLSTSYPDPRLWNNRIAGLAGTTRSTGALAIGAATAISEASIYGRRPDIRSMDFLFRIQKKLDGGELLDDIIKQEIKTHRQLPGYGRPIIRGDERIKPVMALAEKLGFSDGQYIKLAFSIDNFLQKGRWRLNMNIAVVLAALAADQGFAIQEYYQFMILSFSAGMFPCYLDTLSKPEGALFPLRCDRIQYDGKPKRKWRQ